MIDDSFYEDDEAFTVQILPIMDTIVSPIYNKSVVVINSDIYDGTSKYNLYFVIYIIFS